MAQQEIGVLKRQAVDMLRRARKLPVGPNRNDLRQLAVALRHLDVRGVVSSRGVELPPDASPGHTPIRPRP